MRRSLPAAREEVITQPPHFPVARSLDVMIQPVVSSWDDLRRLTAGRAQTCRSGFFFVPLGPAPS